MARGEGTGPGCATSEQEGYLYKVCVPNGYTNGVPVPLVVVLHGCSQSYLDIEVETEMTLFAEERGFIVVYPEQPATANASKCWNWFLPEHQSRGAGEPAAIAGIVSAVKSVYSVDGTQVYVTGMSAGGAMSVILGATYPDLFAAIGASAGLEYKGGTDLPSALLAQANGGPDPDHQGELAYEAMGAQARVVPVIVFHGSMDATVSPTNGHQIISQWAQTNDLASDGIDNDDVDDVADQTVPGQVPNGRSYTRYVYEQGGGSLMEKYIVEGMTHRWSGGSPNGTYTDPSGPKASAIMLDFFFDHPMTPDVPTAATLGSLMAAPRGRAVPVALALAGASVGLALLWRRWHRLQGR